MTLKLSSGPLRLKRLIRSEQAVITLDCMPGLISVLADEHGGNLRLYQAAIVNPNRQTEVILEWNGAPCTSTEHMQIGFNDAFADNMSIAQFLEASGYDSARIEQILDRYELRKLSYLPCLQLPLTSKRQLLLLRALASDSALLFLNDPFQPFNGRWREHFAELLLKDAAEKERITVVLNLSFVPQCWAANEHVQFTDVGHEAEKAVQRAKDLKSKEQNTKEQPKTAEASFSKPVPKVSESLLEERKIRIPIPEPLAYAYRETVDFLFEPLAKISNFVRAYSGIVAVSIFGFLLLIMGFVMLPGLAEQRAKLYEIGSHFTYSWRDVVTYVKEIGNSAKNPQQLSTMQPNFSASPSDQAGNLSPEHGKDPLLDVAEVEASREAGEPGTGQEVDLPHGGSSEAVAYPPEDEGYSHISDIFTLSLYSWLSKGAPFNSSLFWCDGATQSLELTEPGFD